MKTKSFQLILILLVFFIGCTHNKIKNEDQPDLYMGFVNPPSEARPFVRWWWNGDRITSEEVIRQLDVLKTAGIGGIEINPIAFPEEADPLNTKALKWLSPEWNQLLVETAKEAKSRGMITDMIVGSGWPFGGEFLSDNEMIQRILINRLPFSGGDRINISSDKLIELAINAQSRNESEEAKSNDIFFVRLVPSDPSGTEGIIDLSDKLSETGDLKFNVPNGTYDLIYGVRQRGHRDVMHGAPGAAGPVMDHYNKSATIEYLNRLKKISEDTGIPLNELIRALFCDSIELAGANWTDGFEDMFFKKYNYRIEPYYPFVFYDAYIGYSEEKLSSSFRDELLRVRYDYNRLLVNVFLDNFTQTFQDFCTENGLKCRYQAYGIPFLMGMLEGNMIPDIPESNNWLYSVDMETDEWIWNQNHGYMLWNMYASSGGHLADRKIISCEAMTNTGGIFKASLDEIKRHDDMNFITGINHTVLHGYSYSPKEAPFPGWIRYGAYFNERNTWWPYFSKWVDYNARLSYVFQNSRPVKHTAVLGPTGDVWSEYGLTRVPFHTTPWYCYRLWEPISQAGTSCDYLNEKVIQAAETSGGTLNYGPMSYQTLFLAGIESLELETAVAIKKYVVAGGKLIIIDSIPSRSLSLNNALENDATVRSVFAELIKDYPENVIVSNSPEPEKELLPWISSLLNKVKVATDVKIVNPDKNVFQIHSTAGDKDLYFFTNSNRKVTCSMNVVFPTGKKTPWIWNPEDGTRTVFPYESSKNELSIELQPLQSMLIVFEPDMDAPSDGLTQSVGDKAIFDIPGPWHLNFSQIDGKDFDRTFDNLIDFGLSDDPVLNSFAGTVYYTTTFNYDEEGRWLELGELNKGVSEVFLNGTKLGVNWYGRPVFNIENVLQKGDNLLEIKYTTVLSNYVRSMKNNPTAQRWTRNYSNISSGLGGEVKILQ